MTLQRQRKTLALTLGIVASFAYSPSLTWAEQAIQNDNTIMVTATRSNEKNTDIAASISSKNSDEITLDQAVLQRELFNSISGVRITQTGSTIGHMTSIRMPSNTGP